MIGEQPVARAMPTSAFLMPMSVDETAGHLLPLLNASALTQVSRVMPVAMTQTMKTKNALYLARPLSLVVRPELLMMPSF